jgi:hypothetical protein
LQLAVGHFPPQLGIVAGTVGLQVEGSQQKYVMKTDDVLEHSSGIPCIARRATIPLSVRRANRFAKSLADGQMKLTDPINDSG